MLVITRSFRRWLVSVAACVTSLAIAETPATISLEITGLSEAEGNVFISVYDSKDTWLGDNVVVTNKITIADAREGELVLHSMQLPAGEYAISIFYDKNDNGKLDANFIGIPKEPVALSNNAKPKFGPPKYKDAVFSLGADGVTQRINMEKI